MKKGKNNVFWVLILLFVLVLISCDNLTNNGEDGMNTSPNGDTTDEVKEGEAGITKDPKTEIEGVWIADNGELILKFRSGIILFQKRETGFGGHSSILTYGNFNGHHMTEQRLNF